MTVATARLEGAAVTRDALATTFNRAPPSVVRRPFQRAAVLGGDLLQAAAIVLCIPFVILAVGMPIALCIRLLLWIGGLL